MKRSRFSEEQIMGVLKEHQARMGAKELFRKHGIYDAIFYKWRSKNGGMEVLDARRLKERRGLGHEREKLLAAASLCARRDGSACVPVAAGQAGRQGPAAPAA